LRISNVLPVSASFLLAGCAGYAIDYTKPKTSIVGAELGRYGFDSRQSQCMGERLGAVLSVWQLRQLQIVAASVSDQKRLTPAEFLWAAKNVKNGRVGPEVARAAEACGIATAAAAPANSQPAAAPAGTQAVPSRPAAATWVNLGAAQSGQSIAVDASSLAEEGNYRSGWFRLTEPGGARGNAAYLLRVDCSAKTINSMAVRKLGATGAATEEKSFGPNGEGAAAVESGTVMQIAYLALCT
jgi:hypothetical protein